MFASPNTQKRDCGKPTQLVRYEVNLYLGYHLGLQPVIPKSGMLYTTIVTYQMLHHINISDQRKNLTVIHPEWKVFGIVKL